MVKHLLTKSMLLLAALVAGSGSAWATDYYEKVTSTSGIVDGKYLIVYEAGNVAFNGGLATLDAVSNTIAVTISDSKIESTSTTDAAAFTINVTEGTLLSASGKYIGVSSNSNGLKQSEDASTYSNTFSIDTDGTAVITASFDGSTMSLRYNKASGQTRFRYYKNAGQEAIQLYKLVVTPAVKTDPTITFGNGNVRVGKTLDLSTLFESNSSGAVSYSITSGDSFASIEGNTLTGIAEGSVTVKAAQAAAGSYNAGEKSATVTVNAALTLSSIAITTAPTKTTYTEGETFDATGMVVTATYTDESTENVTASCTFTPDGALTTSDTEITVSYAENNITKTATQVITVEEVVDYATLPFSWAGGSSADLQSLVGVTVNADNSDYAAANAPYLVKFNGTGKYIIIKTDSQPGQVSIAIKKLGGANTSTLQIQESADGETFTDVEELYTEGDKEAIVNLFTTKLFKENSRYVRIYFLKAYNGTTGSNVGVGPISITKTTTINLASACTDDENYYGTYSNSSAFVVPADLTVSTISVSEGKLTMTNYAEGDVVKANTGVLVSSATAGDHTVALSAETGTEKDGNMLKASSVAMDAENTKFYRLTMHDGSKLGFWWGAEEGTAFDIAANKAYLAVPDAQAANVQGFVFGDETTGLSEELRVKSEEFAPAVYDLQGRRVARTAKGLYIVNGKKVIIK